MPRERTSLASEVYDAIWQMIVEGTNYHPGTMFSISQIQRDLRKADLNASRPIIHEAIEQLAGEGMLDVHPNIGVTLQMAPSPQELLALQHTRHLFRVLAATAAAQLIWQERRDLQSTAFKLLQDHHCEMNRIAEKAISYDTKNNPSQGFYGIGFEHRSMLTRWERAMFLRMHMRFDEKLLVAGGYDHPCLVVSVRTWGNRSHLLATADAYAEPKVLKDIIDEQSEIIKAIKAVSDEEDRREIQILVAKLRNTLQNRFVKSCERLPIRRTNLLAPEFALKFAGFWDESSNEKTSGKKRRASDRLEN